RSALRQGQPPMNRKLSLGALSAAVLITAGIWFWRAHAPQAATGAPQAAAQSGDTAAASPADNQQSAAPQPGTAQTTTQSGPISTAQAADAGSTSLEHLAAVPASAGLPSSSQWKAGVNYDVISPSQPTTVGPGKVEVLEVF